MTQETQKFNPYNLPEHYLDESSTTAFNRLKNNDYTDAKYSPLDDTKLILTHWLEDCRKEVFNKRFYIDAFRYMAVKAYGTGENALPDYFVNILLTAVKKAPLLELNGVLDELEYMNNKLEREKKVQAKPTAEDITRARYLHMIKEHKPK